MERNALLREVFDIPEVVAASDFVLQLHTGVDHAAQTVSDYVATESLAESFDLALGYVGSALAKGNAQGVFLHGSFGSGKSHFMAVLDLMLRGDAGARAVPGLQAVVAKHSDVLARNLLTAEYHLIGAKSLEEAVFSGFARRIAAIHPEATAPMLHKSDRLFADARRAAGGGRGGVLRRVERGQVRRRVGGVRVGVDCRSPTTGRLRRAPADEDRARSGRGPGGHDVHRVRRGG